MIVGRYQAICFIIIFDIYKAYWTLYGLSRDDADASLMI